MNYFSSSHLTTLIFFCILFCSISLNYFIINTRQLDTRIQCSFSFLSSKISKISLPCIVYESPFIFRFNNLNFFCISLCSISLNYCIIFKWHLDTRIQCSFPFLSLKISKNYLPRAQYFKFCLQITFYSKALTTLIFFCISFRSISLIFLI